MPCKKCGQTRDKKAAGYIARALTLLHEASAKDGSDRSACIAALEQASCRLPAAQPPMQADAAAFYAKRIERIKNSDMTEYAKAFRIERCEKALARARAQKSPPHPTDTTG